MTMKQTGLRTVSAALAKAKQNVAKAKFGPGKHLRQNLALAQAKAEVKGVEKVMNSLTKVKTKVKHQKQVKTQNSGTHVAAEVVAAAKALANSVSGKSQAEAVLRTKMTTEWQKWASRTVASSTSTISRSQAVSQAKAAAKDIEDGITLLKKAKTSNDKKEAVAAFGQAQLAGLVSGQHLVAKEMAKVKRNPSAKNKALLKQAKKLRKSMNKAATAAVKKAAPTNDAKFVAKA